MRATQHDAILGSAHGPRAHLGGEEIEVVMLNSVPTLFEDFYDVRPLLGTNVVGHQLWSRERRQLLGSNSSANALVGDKFQSQQVE